MLPCQTYKWMMLGDDDTLWLAAGLWRLLRHYDHNMPYAIRQEQEPGARLPGGWGIGCQAPHAYAVLCCAVSRECTCFVPGQPTHRPGCISAAEGAPVASGGSAMGSSKVKCQACSRQCSTVPGAAS